jgi:hypothetical protein
MTREQENYAAQVATSYGRSHVSRVFATDGSVEVTAPDGTCTLVSYDGATHARPFNHSVDWSYED